MPGKRVVPVPAGRRLKRFLSWPGRRRTDALGRYEPVAGPAFQQPADAQLGVIKP